MQLTIDATSGASGDMFLGAWIDLFSQLEKEDLFSVDLDLVLLDLNTISKAIDKDLSFSIRSVDRAGSVGVKAELVVDHHHSTHQTHSHSHHVMYGKLVELLRGFERESVLTKSVVEICLQIYEFIAHAESKSHGVSIDKVHFHELGEHDSIFDVIANAYLIDTLNSFCEDEDLHIFSTPVEMGFGKIMTSHGSLDIPAPATQHIISDCAIETTAARQGEYLTPTGAGIIAYLRPSFSMKELEETWNRKISGIGCGTRNPIDKANILKIELLY